MKIIRPIWAICIFLTLISRLHAVPMAIQHLYTEPGGTAGIVLNPQPFLYATAGNNQGGAASAIAHLQYYFQIVGAGFVDVPVLVEASGGVAFSIDRTGSAAVVSRFSLDANLVREASMSPGTYLNAVAGESLFQVSEIRYLTTNVVHTVDLYVSANVFGPLSGAAVANVDPVFTLQGSAADFYRIVLSEGVGNTAAVPENASTIGLLCLALTGLHTLRRRMSAA